MNKKTLSVRSLDDAARLSDGYVKQSLPTPDLERDRLISEAIAKRKNNELKRSASRKIVSSLPLL